MKTKRVPPAAKGWVFHRAVKAKPYQAKLRHAARTHSLGYFATPEEASAAYQGACRMLAAVGPVLARAEAIKVDAATALRLVEHVLREHDDRAPRMPTSEATKRGGAA